MRIMHGGLPASVRQRKRRYSLFSSQDAPQQIDAHSVARRFAWFRGAIDLGAGQHHIDSYIVTLWWQLPRPRVTISKLYVKGACLSRDNSLACAAAPTGTCQFPTVRRVCCLCSQLEAPVRTPRHAAQQRRLLLLRDETEGLSAEFLAASCQAGPPFGFDLLGEGRERQRHDNLPRCKPPLPPPPQ